MVSDPVQQLLALLRREVRGRTRWGPARELVRQGHVGGVEAMDDEIVMVVRVGPHGPDLEVSLYPGDEEWDCDCDPGDGACPHVLAAALALEEARAEGEELPPPLPELPPPPKPEPVPEPEPTRLAPRRSPVAPARRVRPAARPPLRPRPARKPAQPRGPWRVRYTLEPRRPGLKLSRALVFEEQALPVATSLAALAAEQALEVIAEAPDEAIDELVRQGLSDPVQTDCLLPLLEALAECQDVRLSGHSVEVILEPLRRWVAVDRVGDRIRLSIASDVPIDDELGHGLARCGGQLRRLERSTLDNAELHRLTLGQFFDRHEVYRLVVAVLPRLRNHLEVELRTDELPEVVLSEPRVIIGTRLEGDLLIAEATVVYGDPIIARVRRNRLIIAGDGAKAPIREPEEEREAAIEVAQELQLVPGKPLKLSGDRARAFARRLVESDFEVEGDAHLSLLEK